jgi:hypothetical protein
MKTAVEWLIEELGEYFPHEIGGIHLMVEKAKEMEKEQIIMAFAKGSDEESDYHGFQFITPDKAIEYYNETFKQ